MAVGEWAVGAGSGGVGGLLWGGVMLGFWADGTLLVLVSGGVVVEVCGVGAGGKEG